MSGQVVNLFAKTPQANRKSGDVVPFVPKPNTETQIRFVHNYTSDEHFLWVSLALNGTAYTVFMGDEGNLDEIGTFKTQGEADIAGRAAATVVALLSMYARGETLPF